jgi:hypothetical protein
VRSSLGVLSEVDDYIQEFDDYTWKTNDTHATRNMSANPQSETVLLLVKPKPMTRNTGRIRHVSNAT